MITEGNAFVSEVHDRMPVILSEGDFEPRLNNRAGIDLLMPAANNVLQRWAVSKRVNSSRADPDDPSLTDPVQARNAPQDIQFV
jgi:putative SOS response-associated peptidase YedK